VSRVRQFLCAIIGHEFTPAMIFTSLGAGVPAERCLFCRKVRPQVKGRVVAWP
jgi:hypothetical protein